ncbi:hypothetical protein ACU4GI_38980 [Cupriavidus basilensis]
MTLFNFFDKANLTKRDEQVLRELIASPEAEQIRNRAEQATIAYRFTLKAKLGTIDERHNMSITAAGVVLQDAIRAREALEAQLVAARDAEKRTRAASNATESAKLREAHALQQELIASRDLRLDDFYRHLDGAADKLRHLGRITAFPHTSWSGEKSVTYETNAGDVAAFMAMLKDAMADVTGMALLPLTRNEVSERLTALTHKLEPALDAFSLPTPRLDVDGEVTLSRERLKLADVLQDNGIREPGDVPASATAQASPHAKAGCQPAETRRR